MQAQEQGEHLLALKVMRLTRPTLVSPLIVSCEPKDLPQNSFHEMLQKDDTAVAGLETLAAGQFMLLPQSFGNIYLGETFSSYICVHNCTSHAVEGVTVKADLQSNTTRINLPMHEKQSMPARLGPEETLDDVIRYEVKEIGTHILVCEVNYSSLAGLPQHFRKFFKFQVLKPLDVKTKFYNADVNEIYLEAQIQNITTGPFCLEKVELDAAEHYTVTPLNTLPNGESVFTSKNMLQPNNSCQFLYCIKAKPDLAGSPKAMLTSKAVGKLDIVWRSNLGEKGRLQTSQLERLDFELKDVRLEVVEANNIVKISDPFTFKCRVTNCSERPMELLVKLENELTIDSDFMGGVEIRLDPLDPGQHCIFPITICPIRLGLIKISPLILINVLSKERYTIDKVVDIFVVDEDYHEDDAFQINKFVRYHNTAKEQAAGQSSDLQVI